MQRKSGAILRPMATRSPRGKGKTFAEEFGERLKAARERRELTQEAVAEAAEMQASRLSEYESGRLVPQLERAAKLAAALGVSLDELVGLREGGAPGEVRDGRLRASMLALDATGREGYIDATSMVAEAFVVMASHDEIEARRKHRPKGSPGRAGGS